MSRRHGRRLTLADEREMLTRLRAVAAEEGFGGLLEKVRLDERDPGEVAFHDQLLAAANEAELSLLRNGPAIGLPERTTVPVAVGLPLILAALLRCAAHSRCEHVTTGTVPLFAVPNARVIACKRCILRFRGAIAAADARNRAGDQTCDFCLEEAKDNRFKLIGLHVGPVQLFGDACSACVVELGADRMHERRGLARWRRRQT